jgi:hypothetical protein
MLDVCHADTFEASWTLSTSIDLDDSPDRHITPEPVAAMSVPLIGIAIDPKTRASFRPWSAKRAG